MRPTATSLAGSGLPRTDPGGMGVDPAGIAAFIDTAAALGLELHSLMVLRHGHVIAEAWWAPYCADHPHMQHSLAKSFTATAIGLAIDAGLFGLDDRVVSFFPGRVPPEPNLAAMTVHHLLTMSTGHLAGISGSVWRGIRTDWTAEFLREPVPEPPGRRFVYSSASSYMLSAILQRVSGERLADFLDARLFRPLEMVGMQWDVCPHGVNPGGNGLSCPTEALLKLGLVHLQGGMWQGRRVLPEWWVREATRAHIVDESPVDGELHLPGPAGALPRPYGFHWWMGPAGAYYAAGMFGQFSIVLPEQDAVVAMTAALPAQDRRLPELVWRDLAPALGGGAGPGSVDLRQRLSSLALDLPTPGPASVQAGLANSRAFWFAPNEDGVERIGFDFAADRCVFRLTDQRGTHVVEAGTAAWIEGTTTMTGDRLHHGYQPDQLRVCAAGGWRDDQVFEMTWVFVETAFRDRVKCRFDGDRVTFERSVNVNSGATSRPVIVGSAERSAFVRPR